jgi:hypothetical protein
MTDLFPSTKRRKPEDELPELKPGWLVAAGAALVLFVLFLLFLPSGLAGCGPGEACVVRNGGPLDDKAIRKTMTPGSAIQPVGFFSQIRHYRSSENQSQYRIVSNPAESDSSSVDFVQVPTKDGVQVRLEGTVFFTTPFTGADDDDLLREFDQRFGNRTFHGKNVWEDSDGYAAWQDVVFRPLLNNAIRSTILTFDCKDLISSCALIEGAKARGNIRALTEGRDNSQNFERVGTAIAVRLRNNIRESLRSGKSDETFLTNISFKLEDVELPAGLQNQINAVQQANAKIAEAYAENQASKAEAEKNRRIAASLKQSPELKEVRIAEINRDIAEIYAKSGARLTIIQGGGQPLIQAGK